MTDNRFLWEYDEALGFDGLCGIDEVGRGPLAGPVCAACVVLPRGLELNALNDSKKMTEKRREETFRLLTECPQVYYGIGFADQREIDEFNILQATFLAMQRAYAELLTRLPDKKVLRLALVDGNRDPHLPLETRLVVKGDGTSAHIAAASVLAKVTRDRLMTEYAGEYPHYGWEKNKGYGSKEHYAGIAAHGITPLHRRSFLKNLSEKHYDGK